MRKIKIGEAMQPHNTINKKGFYVLTQSYQMPLEIEGVKKVFIVPKGFTYDGASIPRSCWTFLGLYPDGLIRGGATFHDWLYRNSGAVSCSINMPYSFRRKEADYILKMVLEKSGLGFFKTHLVYFAVRLFGKKNWNK